MMSKGDVSMTEIAVFNYEDTPEITPHVFTVWIVTFKSGAKQLQVWHKNAKIEHVVESMKAKHPKIKFDVAIADVGVFYLYYTGLNIPSGRKVNQDMEEEIMINSKALNLHIVQAEKGIKRAEQHIELLENFDRRVLVDSRLELAAHHLANARDHVRMARVCKEV
jgi:hypothetical protein